MARDIYKLVGEMNYDGLITDTTPAEQVAAGTIRKVTDAANLVRGTILAKSSGTAGDGKLVILGTAASTDEILTPDAILCDDTDVDSAADVRVAVYHGGCFDLTKCTVKEGYSITEDDKDKLRERGIVFKDAADAR